VSDVEGKAVRRDGLGCFDAHTSVVVAVVGAVEEGGGGEDGGLHEWTLRC